MAKFTPTFTVHSLASPTLKHALPDAFEVRVREALNGEYYVSFVYPRLADDSERYGLLTQDSVIEFPDDAILRKLARQRFTINRVEEIRDGRRIYKRIEASHIAFNLNRYYYDDYTDFSAAEPLSDMLALLSADTPYDFGVSGTFADTDIFEYGEDTRFNLAQKLRTTYNAELAFDNETITFTSHKGGNYGARVAYKLNMRGITKTAHSMERITRLYGYGKNGLTIEGYSGHTTKYIDSAYYDAGNPYATSVTFAEIESQAQLLAEMTKHLAKYELPNVSYAVDFVDLAKVDPEFQAEVIREAGDTVTVTDDELGYAFEARVMEYEWYPYEPRRGSVTLANFRPLNTVDYVYQAAVGVKKAIKYTSTNAILKGLKYDDSITLVDGLGMRVSDASNRELVRLGQYEPGKYGLAMFNTSGTKTLWQDAATGNAYFSGTITGAQVNASTFSGGTFVGGSFTGGTFRTTGSYPYAEISSGSNAITAYFEADSYVSMQPNGGTLPQILFHYYGTETRLFSMFNGVSDDFYIQSQARVNIQSTADIVLSPAFGHYVRVVDFDRIIAGTTTLGFQLNSMSTSISSLSGSLSGIYSALSSLDSRVSALESA